MFVARIRTKSLADLCFRVGSSLAAGIDIRKCWQRENDRATGKMREMTGTILQQVQEGNDLAEAFDRTGDYFPRLVRAMVRVGESTGGLDQIFLSLARYYQEVLSARQLLRRFVAWPLFELFVTAVIVGILIWIPAVLPKMDGRPQDILGLGLVGLPGLLVYAAALTVLAGLAATFAENVRQDRWGARQVMNFLEKVPWLGQPLRDLAFARVTWSLGLTTNTSMDLRDSLALALDASLLPRLMRCSESLRLEIARGRELSEAALRTKQFPPEFLDAIQVGEQTGNLSESMQRLAVQYQERARMAIQKLATVAGMAVWLLVATVMIILIFQLFGRYVGAIQSLT